MREKMNNMAVPSRASVSRVAAALALIAGSVLASGAHAQQYPVTPKQRATAQQVASRGVPVADLVANAPDTYVVKRGDTLWSIAKRFEVSHEDILRWNELESAAVITPGDALTIFVKKG